MLTIKEVAKEANVSVATVSRVINNNVPVSSKARIKVENAIKKMNYEPNMLGRNLRRSENRFILALLPNISNPFYAAIIKGVEDTAMSQGYNVILCQTDAEPEREKSYLNLLKQKLADGVINLDPILDEDFLMKIGEKYPIIQCCEYSENLDITYVSIDNKAAAYKATNHLIDIGHKNIALINSNEKYVYARQRKEGYIKALIDSNIKPNDKWIVNVDLDFESAQSAVEYLLALDEKPDAIFAVSDILAIGALKAIAEARLRVPEDIAVVGFDNIPYAKIVTPALTTVNQPMYTIGTKACKMLIHKLRKDKDVSNEILDVQLIIRESTVKQFKE